MIRQSLDRLLGNIEIMLACNLVHGDLSAYNILYWRGRAMIIDLPQAADTRTNPNARRLLERDVANLCRYFARQGVPRDFCAIAAELWDRHMNAAL